MEKKILWRPNQNFIASCNLTQYQQWLYKKNIAACDSYETLWQWSADQIDEFWHSIWDYFQILHDGDFSEVTRGGEMPNIEWFAGTRLNYTEHLFRH
ncbi:MAG: acetoacetate--CoA ligase, partial [Saprospiraceae bacterium]|nr:acetoacetate--CoA ligase [Saprospiraceae bacterium]